MLSKQTIHRTLTAAGLAAALLLAAVPGQAAPPTATERAESASVERLAGYLLSARNDPSLRFEVSAT